MLGIHLKTSLEKRKHVMPSSLVTNQSICLLTIVPLMWDLKSERLPCWLETQYSVCFTVLNGRDERASIRSGTLRKISVMHLCIYAFMHHWPGKRQVNHVTPELTFCVHVSSMVAVTETCWIFLLFLLKAHSSQKRQTKNPSICPEEKCSSMLNFVWHQSTKNVLISSISGC